MNVRLEEKLCLLVMVGVGAGERSQELVALTDVYRESTPALADLPRVCKRRGMRPRWCPWATAPWASGQRRGRCSRRLLGSSGAGSNVLAATPNRRTRSSSWFGE